LKNGALLRVIFKKSDQNKTEIIAKCTFSAQFTAIFARFGQPLGSAVEGSGRSRFAVEAAHKGGSQTSTGLITASTPMRALFSTFAIVQLPCGFGQSASSSICFGQSR
jgi:hypothetical protein